MTNRDHLILLGKAVFGPLWQNSVARALGVNPRQVHRWVSGEYEPSDGVINDLLLVARERKQQIADAIKSI